MVTFQTITAEQFKKNEMKFGIQADITNVKVESVN